MAEQRRRHLDHREAELALGRGKSLEIFLGPCGPADGAGVRFAALDGTPDAVTVAVFEMQNPDPGFLDLYEAVPLGGDSEDGVVLEARFESLAAALNALADTYPGTPLGIVNFGVLSDEYLTHLRRASNG